MKLNSEPSVQMFIFIFSLFVFTLVYSHVLFRTYVCVCVHECVSCAALNWREAADLVERPALAEEGCA